MSRKPGIMVLALILMAAALNVSILIFNLTLPSRAAVAGMDYRALVTDSDFKRVVQTIVETCRANVYAEVRQGPWRLVGSGGGQLKGVANPPFLAP